MDYLQVGYYSSINDTSIMNEQESWEKEFDELMEQIPTPFGIKSFISNLLTSRDTYWKERVIEDVNRHIQNRISDLMKEIRSQEGEDGTIRYTKARLYEALKIRDELQDIPNVELPHTKS